MTKKFQAIILTDSIAVGTGLRPLGAYAIANELRTQGYQVLVVNYITYIESSFIEKIIEKFVSEETLFLGYSSSLFIDTRSTKDPEFNFLPWEVDFFKKINLLAKKKNPNLQIVFGGANTKRMTRQNLKYNDSLGVDYVIHGYSESMILDFVKKLESNEPQQISSKFNKLKEIDYDFKGENFNFRNSLHNWAFEDFIAQGEALPLEVARGCIFKCKFCAYPLLGKHPKDDSYIKLEENIKTEILENYEKFKTLSYFIVDDTFNERTDKIEIMLRIRDSVKLDLNFVGYNRLDLIARRPEQINLLKNLNFNGLFFGIESMNYESAKSIGKGLRPEKIKETLYKFKDEFPESNITAGFIIGLPHENEETLQSWIPWLLNKDCPIDCCLFNPLHLTKNTHSQSEFDKNPEKYGYTPDEKLGNWSNEYWNRDECSKISERLKWMLIHQGKSKIPGTWAVNLLKLGYNFDKLTSTTVKEMLSADFQRTLDLNMKSFVDDYVKKIMML
jgi:hypothetical protein